MDLKLLRAFAQLAEAGHYGIAAGRLAVTQSTLSKQIQTLEEQVGGTLFLRGRHGAKLTPLGTLLLREADRLLRLSEEVGGRIARARSGLAGHLDIGFGISTLDLAPRLIAAFRDAVPDCQITLNDMSSSEQHRRLRDGTLDLGFCRAPSASGDLAFLPLLEERLALVVLAGTVQPPLSDLSPLNALGFVALSPGRGPGLTSQIARWSHGARFEPRIVHYAEDVLTIHAVVAAGLGAALLPMTGMQALGSRTQLVPLDGDASCWPVGLCWRSVDTNRLLRHFIEHAVQNSKAIS